MRLFSRSLTLSIAAALIVSACSGSDGAETTTTTTTAPSTSSSSTTTLPPTTTRGTGRAFTLPDFDVPVSPLNGLPATSEEALDRRVIAVKVDNHPRARPQSGLQEADAVLELLVEGGFSRFIALFHDNDSTYVGPVRSIRPTDSTLVAAMDGTLVISGGQPWVRNLATARGVPFFIETSYSLFRIGSRSAPHNLYGDTVQMREQADQLGFGDEFGNPLYKVAPRASLPSERATELVLNWGSGHQVTWRFQNGEYLRWEGSQEHHWIDSEGEGEQISADVLVVLVGTQYVAAGGGKTLPATETTGTGQAHVFHDGRVLSGTWTRETDDDSFIFTADDGSEMTVPPGRPWIQVFPHSGFLDWS